MSITSSFRRERSSFRVPDVRPPESKKSFFIDGTLSPEQVRRTSRELAEIIADPERYIDKGGAGSVHRLSEGLCFKAIEPRRLSPNAHLLDIGNHVAVEAQYLMRISRLNISGVRTCTCYGFSVSTRFEDPDILLMEELDAVNLQHVLNGTAHIPESFHPNIFLDDYWSFLEALHEEGVAHGDIAPRNVMIDRKTGKPRVIDFGRSQDIPLNTKKGQALIDRDVTDYELVYNAVGRKFALE